MSSRQLETIGDIPYKPTSDAGKKKSLKLTMWFLLFFPLTLFFFWNSLVDADDDALCVLLFFVYGYCYKKKMISFQ